MDLEKRISNLSPQQRKLFESKLEKQGIDISQLNIPLTEISKKQTIEDRSPHLKKRKKTIDQPIEPTEEKEYYPLSASQKRMYILNLFLQYSIPLVFQVEGNLDRNRLEEVFRLLIKRHESFRTSIEVIGEEPVQRVHPYKDVAFEIEYYEADAGEELIKNFFRPFHLTQTSLLRVRLIKLSPTRHLFLINIHHLTADGFSWGVMIRELIRLYKGETLPELKIGHKDYSNWQEQWLKGESYKKQESYWLNQFTGELPVLELPTDYPRPLMQDFKGSSVRFQVSGEIFQALKTLAALENASLFMALLTILNMLLTRYTPHQQEDVVIGTLIAGREPGELQNIIGLFINTLALRNSPQKNKTTQKFLGEVKQNTLKAYENQSYPFGNLMDKVVKKKDLSRNPLFDVMLIYQNRILGNLEAAGLRFIRQFELEPPEHAQQDITLWVRKGENHIDIELEYCTALYKQETMERFAKHFLNLLTNAAANPDLKLSEIDMMDQREKQQILEQFNSTETDFPADKMVHQLFAEQAERTPDNIAIVGPLPKYGSYMTYMTNISYRELSQQSQQLAYLLKEKGVKPDTIVGIMMERSGEMMVGLLGILKAGGAYLPIDPDYPEKRIKYILEDSKVNILALNSNYFSHSYFEGNLDFVYVDEVTKKIPQKGISIHPSTLLPFYPSQSSLAYVIYTSGSTGKPKGVMVNHQNLLVYLNAFEQEFDLLPTDTVIQQAAYSFDAFAEEIYPILLKGGKIAVPGKDEVKDMALLTDFILRQEVTIIDCSPLLLNQLNQLELESPIRIFISGGDVLKGEHVHHLVKKGTVYNTYGPTEATICASYYKCPDDILQNVPIGQPIANYCIYILDQNQQLLPVGIPGELCISGHGVSRGYLNRPGLTAEKFDHDLWDLWDYQDKKINYMSLEGTRGSHAAMQSPRHRFSQYPIPPLPHYPIYLTGDLARWLTDGNIEYLGRIDQQIKIRGYRIELQEIEHHLMGHDNIKEAVVIDKENEVKNKYLCAYIVPTKEKQDQEFTLSVSGLREYLAGELPDYMIPTHFVKIDHIPLTPNGKIDMKALHEYDSKGKIEIGAQYAAPTNEIEEKLADIWSEILMHHPIGIHDNFFDLGGQSILAMQTVAKIQEVFNVKIPLITFFQVGTLRGIADIISGLRPEYQDRQQGTVKKSKGLIQPFEMEKVPLMRTVLVQLENRGHFFFIDMHHIITDGISMDIIADEFAEIYTGVELAKFPIQYKDYSQWQRNLFTSHQFRKQEKYWLDIFAGELPRLNFPLDYPRPQVRKWDGKKVQVKVGTELTLQLKKLAAAQEVTLFMLLLAVYTIVLAKNCHQEDIILGTPVSGRPHANLTQMVGIFVNTLALRMKPQNHLTFYEFLHQVKDRTLSALENQDYPFEMLVEKLNLSGETSRNPLFDTMFTVQQDYEQDTIKTGNLTFIPYNPEGNRAMFDLILGAVVIHSDIRLIFTYNLHLFGENSIRQMAGHYIAVLSWIVQASDRPIKEIDMSMPFPTSRDMKVPALSSYTDPDQQKNRFLDDQLPIEISTSQEPLTQQQKDWILYNFNDSSMEYPQEMTIHHLFEQQVDTTPLQTAVICQNRQLTYEELNKKSNQVAVLLKEKGLESDSCVGLMVEPSIELMVGILGILKAGACYLPIDHNYPEKRIRYLVQDASVSILLTQNHLHSKLSFLSKYISCVALLDTLKHGRRITNDGFPKSHLTAAVKPDQLAYVIYTSGSTGRPKGVIVDHKAVVNRLVWMQKKYPLTAADSFLQQTTFLFDVSVIEFFGWFMGGARLCFLEFKDNSDMQKILHVIEIQHITAVSFTSTVLHTFFISIGKEGVGKLASLKWIFCAGEQLPMSLVEKWSASPIKTKLENLYGPTEATVYASYYSCNRLSCQKPVPIGKPLGNTRLYVLNEHQELLPPGEVGELVLAGASLARGYLNRPGLTAEKFLPDPFFPGERMYLTGDFAKLLPDGNMVYLGRMDNQVKIKGIRIELEEIEAVLLKHPDIHKAAVITRVNNQGVNYLSAYIVTQKDLTLKDLRTYMLEKVPEFMVPSAFFKVDQMPLTTSGKLDRKLLPQCGTPIKDDIQYIAPRNDLEHQLANDWAEILKLDKIGILHNFFEMGGDSLMGNLLLARINNRFNVGTAIKDLFDAPTIREFSKVLSHSKAQKYTPITPVEKKEYYFATSAQKRLFILHQLNKDDTSYNLPMGMIIEGSLDKDRLKNTVKHLVMRHESLRTGFTMQDGKIVQKIEENPDIEIEFFEGEGWDDSYIEKIINGDIQLHRTPQQVEDNLLSGIKPTKVEWQIKRDMLKKYGAYHASSAQKRLYLINQLYGNSILYNMPFGWIIHGHLQPPRLENAVKKLVQRHETLRTSFSEKDGEVLQKVHERLEFQLKYKELGANSTKDINVIIDDFLQPFDLTNVPLWRMGLVQLESDQQLLLFDIHHIICDGVSMGVMINDLMTIYIGKELPEPDYQYVDFTLWQNKQWQSDRIKRQEQYWLKILEGELPAWEMPTDYPRSLAPNIDGEVIEFEMDRELTAKIKKLASKNSTTLYVVLLTLYNILLFKTTGQEDIVVGTPVTGRTHSEFESIIGMFINTLALRNQPSGSKTFNGFLQEVSQHVFSAFENQDYPFEMLVEKLLPQRHLNRNPLFENIFALQNFSQNLEITDSVQGKLKFFPYKYKEKIAKFDIILFAFEKEGGMLFDLQYRSSLFRQDTMEQFIRLFIKLTQDAVTNPGLKIFQMQIITEEEIKHLLDVLNATDTEYPKDKTIRQLFEKQVEITPNNIAVVGSYEGTRGLAPLYITYKQLNQQANQQAYLLIEKGVQPDTIAAIMLERSIEMILGVLAILKAGGAYLPISPDYPKERIHYMLAESDTNVLVTTENLFEDSMTGSWRGEIMFLSTTPGNSPTSTSTCQVSPENLAYIIYTSGTTGKPKGAMVRHFNVVRLVKNTNYIQFKENDRILQTGALEFDASTFEIWGSLLNGLQLTLVKNEVILSPGKLKETLEKNRITTIWLTAPLFNQLLEEEIEIFRGLKNLLVGGDVLSPPHINRLRSQYPRLKIINGYGPTENTTFSTTFLIDREYHESIPIGKPIANSTAYIVDKYGNLQPIGIVGELWVGGDGVSRGYLNNPELTAEKFDRDLWDYRNYQDEVKKQKIKIQKVPGKGINRSHMSYISYTYRTGDLARWLKDGNIQFLGREDHQVKIRGFRVELGEIESQLLKHPGIKEAVVLYKTDKSSDKYLCAYIVSSTRGLELELKSYLSHLMPDYMIPSYFVQIEKMPLNPNGKIDRRALPEPETGKTGKDYIPPRDEIERKLVDIWAEVLGRDTLHAAQLRESLGIDDDFFQLGGHSLKATVLAAKIHKNLNVKLSLVDIFSAPLIRELSAIIKKETKNQFAAIQPVEKKDFYPLSSAQRRIYILQQMETNATTYNIPQIAILEGTIDKIRLHDTLKRLIRRHESFRTSFVMVDEEPVQRVRHRDEIEFEIEYYQVEVKEEEQKTEEKQKTRDDRPGYHLSSVIRHLSSEFIHHFDLSKAPLLRVGLIETAEKQYIFMVDIHHIIADGVSHALLVKDFMALYGREEEKLAKIPIQYKDYSQWQNSEIQKQAIKKQESYWIKQFQGDIQVLELPTDYPRPATQSFEGNTLAFEIGSKETKALKQLAQQAGVTLFMVLLSLFAILLSKLTGHGEEDILVGTPISGRRHADLEQVIGMFVNTLVLRNSPYGHLTFKEFINQVKETAIQAFENQDYLFEDLVDHPGLNIKRDPGRNPLFDVAFALQNLDIPEIQVPGLNLGPYQGENITKTAKFDITLIGQERGEILYFTFEYCTRLFKQESLVKFIRYFREIVSSVLENPEKKISGIEIILAEEKNQILFDFNDTSTPYPKEKTIHELFEKQVEITPDNIAVVGSYEGTRGLTPLYITYKQLNQQTNQLAYLLIEKGIQSDTIVGIMLERSIRMIVGVLAILKAGGAYLPIDPDYPEERKQYMLKDSNAKVLVVDDTSCASWLSFAPEALLNLSAGHHLNFPASQLPSFPTSLYSNLAYVIYTSGTTGKPKGTLTSHFNVTRVVKNTDYISITREDRILQLSNYAFDGSVFDIYGALLNGAALVMIEKENLLVLDQLTELIRREKITVFFVTTALFNALVDLKIDCLDKIRNVLFGGERVSLRHAEKSLEYLGKDRVIHVYGPTETTVYATYFFINSINRGLGTVPIGKPISNTTVYILDKYQKPVPRGIAGEIYIGGDGVARGYLNSPELTAEKFDHDLWDLLDYHDKRKKVPGKKILKGSHKDYMHSCGHTAMQSPRHHSTQYPITPLPHHPIYRTGDLARWLPDGNIEFIGRIDQQIKLRGFRIELGEIENRLLDHERVSEVVVIDREINQSEKYLCAYIVPHPVETRDNTNTAPLSNQLAKYLAATLPDYMIPSYFIEIKNIPLNPNGKVDRKALPQPEVLTGSKYVAPRDQLEEKLVEIWSEVLREGLPLKPEELPPIGIDDNFFELGGHSLKAVRIIAKIHKELDIKLSLLEIFTSPTIREMAATAANIEKKQGKQTYKNIKNIEEKDFYEISHYQERLWVFNQAHPGDISYNLPERITFYHKMDEEIIKKVLSRLIERHQGLRTTFREVDGQPVQVIEKKVDLPFRVIDLTSMGKSKKQQEREKIFVRETQTPFDLSKAPIFRSILVKLEPDQYDFIFNMYHIIADGWSMEILKKDFLALYDGFQEGKDIDLEPLQLQYTDLVGWLNQQINSPATGKKAHEYWKSKLEKGFPPLSLPYDYPKNCHRPQNIGAFYRFVIHQDIQKRLKTLAAHHQTSLFIVMFSVLNLLLARLSGQKDITCRIPTAVRNHISLHPVVGYFINPIFIKNPVEDNDGKNFADFLRKVDANTHKAFQHQWYPLERVVEKHRLKYPEITLSFNMLNMFSAVTAATDLEKFDSFHGERPMDEKFPLILQFMEFRNGIEMVLRYKKGLFKPSTIESMANQYVELLDEMAVFTSFTNA